MWMWVSQKIVFKYIRWFQWEIFGTCANLKLNFLMLDTASGKGLFWTAHYKHNNNHLTLFSSVFKSKRNWKEQWKSVLFQKAYKKIKKAQFYVKTTDPFNVSCQCMENFYVRHGWHPLYGSKRLEELNSYEAIRLMSINIKVIFENSGLKKSGRVTSNYHAIIAYADFAKWWWVFCFIQRYSPRLRRIIVNFIEGKSPHLDLSFNYQLSQKINSVCLLYVRPYILALNRLLST